VSMVSKGRKPSKRMLDEACYEYIRCIFEDTIGDGRPIDESTPEWHMYVNNVKPSIFRLVKNVVTAALEAEAWESDNEASE